MSTVDMQLGLYIMQQYDVATIDFSIIRDTGTRQKKNLHFTKLK